MSIATNPGGNFHGLLHTVFVREKGFAIQLKVGCRPRIWLGVRNPKPIGFRCLELTTYEFQSEHVEDILNLAPADTPALEMLQQTGRTGFFLADYPAIVYAEKRDGEVEFFIHREPEPRSQRNDEEE